MTVQEVFEAAKALSLDEQYELLHRLQVNLKPLPPTLSPEWEEEIKRRVAELDSGEAETYSWEEVKEFARNRVQHGG